MQRLLEALVAVVAVGLVAGCGSTGDSPLVATAAPPQAAELAWEERSPESGPGLVFRVHRFAVTSDGWEADVEIENRSGIAWEMGEDPVAVGQSFGIMLFATDELGEVEQRSRDGELPGLRPARTFDPALPTRLAPNARWRAVVSAPGTLAAGRYVRVVFGPLIALADPPEGMPSQFVWITDHAYRLRS